MSRHDNVLDNLAIVESTIKPENAENVKMIMIPYSKKCPLVTPAVPLSHGGSST